MLGILMLDTRFPRPPGDIGHPTSFSMPVAYRVVRGADPARVVRGSDPALLQPFVEAGLELVNQGARAIATSCGFLARWQPELQRALPVPVWSSALLLLPGLPRPGVITAEAASLTPAHFTGVDADPATPVEGIAPGSLLHRTLLQDLDRLDMDDAREQVLAAGRRLVRRHPDLRSVVLECTNLPPYAGALQADIGLPVHHVLTLLHQRWQALSAAG